MRGLDRLCVLSLALLAACSGQSKAVGAYALDVKALIDGMFAQMKSKMPKDADEAQARQMVEGMLGKASATLDLKADGTLAMTGEMMGKKTDAKGTWTEAGGVLTIKTKEGDQPEETKTGKLGDGTITVTENKDGMTVEMVFRKK